MNRFLDIRLAKISWPWNRGQRSLKVIETDRYRSMGLFRTVSEINNDFSRKSQIFQFPVYFANPLKGFPGNWVSALEVKKLESWGYRAEKEVWRCLQPWIQYTNVTDGRTDGRTRCHSKDHALRRRAGKSRVCPSVGPKRNGRDPKPVYLGYLCIVMGKLK